MFFNPFFEDQSKEIMLNIKANHLFPCQKEIQKVEKEFKISEDREIYATRLMIIVPDKEDAVKKGMPPVPLSPSESWRVKF